MSWQPRSTDLLAPDPGAVHATIYNAGHPGRHELTARTACLRAVVVDAAAHGHHLLVLEQDDSLIRTTDAPSTLRRTPPDARTSSPTNTAAPSTSSSSPSPMRSPGAGPRAATGATGSNRRRELARRPRRPRCRGERSVGRATHHDQLHRHPVVRHLGGVLDPRWLVVAGRRTGAGPRVAPGKDAP